MDVIVPASGAGYTGPTIVVGPTPPEDTTAVWIDTSA